MEPRLGPISLMFDVKVGRYFRASVTPEEINCLRAFFQDLETHGIGHGFKRVAGDFWLIHACNHIIEIQLRRGGSGVVQRIYRDVSSSLPE
jgi:hypothetical protein